MGSIPINSKHKVIRRKSQYNNGTKGFAINILSLMRLSFNGRMMISKIIHIGSNPVRRAMYF